VNESKVRWPHSGFEGRLETELVKVVTQRAAVPQGPQRRPSVRAGLAAGTAITAVVAATHHWALLIPAQARWGGLAVAVAVAALAGLYPAVRAARLSPAEALRTG